MKAAPFHGLWSWAEQREKHVCLCYAYRLRPETTCGSGFSTSPRTWVQRIDTYLSAVCLSDSHIPIFIINTKCSLKIDNRTGNDPLCEWLLRLLLSPLTPALLPCRDTQRQVRRRGVCGYACAHLPPLPTESIIQACGKAPGCLNPA